MLEKNTKYCVRTTEKKYINNEAKRMGSMTSGETSILYYKSTNHHNFIINEITYKT